MLRYSHGVIACTVGAVLCYLLGFMMMMSDISAEILGNAVGAYFFMMAPIWIMQMFYSMHASSMVEASAHAKALQTSIPTLISGIACVLSYIVVIVIQIKKGMNSPQNSEYIALELLMIAVVTMIYTCYMGVALKYFVLSTIVFLISFLGISMYLNIGRFLQFGIAIPVWAAGICGMGVIGLGMLAQYGLSRLVYRAPISKYAQLTSLRKTM